MSGPRFLMLDFETRSRISVSDASYRKYASDPTTNVLCLGLQWDGRPATVKIPVAGPVFRPGYDQTPIEIQHAVQYGIPIYAQNAVFDRVVYEEHCVKKLGWLPIPTHLWMDLMAIAAYYSLPRNLDGMAKALRLQSRKDKEGATALKAVYKPRKPRKAEIKEWLAVPGHTIDNMPLLWREEPERLARIYEYCRVDVETQTEALQLLGPLPPERLADWRFDQVINARGIPIDFAAVVDCSIRIDGSMEHYNRRMAQITANMHHPDGMVKKVTERQKLVDWLQLQGIDTVSLDKAAVEHLLRRPDLPKHVEEVLVMRQEAGRSSLGKIETIIEQTDIDWRTRDTLMYHGAGTGRWTGRGWQPHNLPRECLSVEEAEKFYSCLMTGRDFDLPWSLPETVSRAIRSFIAPHTPDRVLYVSDFAAIEARVLAWLAGCELLLTAFRSGKCVYRQFGSRASGKPEDQIGKKDRERQLGKVSVLGLGYGMGGKDRIVKQKDPVTGEVVAIVTMSKFRETAAAPPYNIDLTPDQSESIVNLYRSTYPEVPRMWAAMEEAFIAAIRYDQVVTWGKFLFGTAIVGHYRFAWIQLPSGRRLWYPEPELEEIKRPYGKTALRATFMGVNPTNKQWVRQNTWGGTLTENCWSGDTLLLTSRGVKRIIDISPDDLLWDGVEWVSHCGVICKGCHPTVEFAGCRVTEDHLVWDGEWKRVTETTTASCYSAFERLHRHPFWHAGGSEAPWVRREARRVVAAMRLRRYQTDGGEGVCETPDKNLWMLILRTGGFIKENSRRFEVPTVRNLEVNAGEVLQPKAQGVPQLWGQRHHSVPEVAAVRELQGGHDRRVRTRTGAGDRQAEQQQGVLQEQLPVGAAEDKSQKQENKHREKFSRVWESDRLRGSGEVWNQCDHDPLPDLAELAGPPATDAPGPTEQVYDIRNSGPRHRYTVVSPDGRCFLAHNCTQAVAADLLINSMKRVEALGFEVILSVHDEVVAEGPVTLDPQVFHKAMVGPLPAWADGLPIECESQIMRRYGKEGTPIK